MGRRKLPHGGGWTLNRPGTLAWQEELAACIRDYWADRGDRVRTWIEPVGESDMTFQLRSDMRNGLPI